MVDAGLIVLVSFTSPFRYERRVARDLFAEGDFKEVFIDTPIDECERCDTKGLYALARQDKLKNFTGVDSAYEAPIAPESQVRTLGRAPEDCVDEILAILD